MFGLGTAELIIILVILVMLFGVGKLPQVGRMLGSGIRSFKDGMNDPVEETTKTKKAEPELIDADRTVEPTVQEKKTSETW